MNGKKWLEDSIYEEKQGEDAASILSRVSTDIENRDLRDVQLLVKAAGILKNSPEKCLDLWGQVLDAAYRLTPQPEEIIFWLSEAKHFAGLHLQNRLTQLKLDPDLLNNPLEAIIQVYQVGSVLYKKYNLEAFRVSQIYFYHYYSLFDQMEKESEDKDIIRCYSASIAVQAMGFANITGCYLEGLAVARFTAGLFTGINVHTASPFDPGEFNKFFNYSSFRLGYYAAIAAKKTGRFPEALDWSRRAEPYVSSLGEAALMSDYFARRGEICIELGQAEEALTWFEKAVAVPGLSPQEKDDAKKRLDAAKDEITGNDFGSSNFFANFSSREDIELLKQLSELILSGNEKPGDLSNVFEILQRTMLGNSTGKLSLDVLPDDERKIKDSLILLSARDAMSKNNIPSLENLLPEIERIAGSDSAFQLNAAFFLVRYRVEKGEPMTWESISPLVSRLSKLPQSLILEHLLDLSHIILSLDEKELPQASTAIAALIDKITFAGKVERTPEEVVHESAGLTVNIESLLTMLVFMARAVPGNGEWWLENVSRLKFLSSYRGQRMQKESRLFRYAAELPLDTVRRIENMTGTLARLSMEKKGIRYDARKENEIKLMTMLFPLFNRDWSYHQSQNMEMCYPEIIHIETTGFSRSESQAKSFIKVVYTVSVVYTGDHWEAYIPDTGINKNDAAGYLESIKHPGAFGRHIDVWKKPKNPQGINIEAGMKLKQALLPIPGEDGLPSIMGVRSTGIFHRLPIDILPWSCDEKTGEVTQWIGEKMASVLLTGQNKDLSVLESRLSIKSIAVFANFSFKGRGRNLPGVRKEVEAIKRVIDKKGDMSLELFIEGASNRENFLRLSGDKAPQVLHIATHGMTCENHPAASYIMLADTNPQGMPVIGAVGYHDIMLMDLRPCDLVILSACSTHEGKSILGEGIMGLAWAFKAAGAKAVIGTRWPVSDQAAVEFWEKFYENLGEGLPIGKAFLGARLHIMKQERWSHPYYWGVFQLIV